MTCIAAWRDDASGQVHMSSDSATVDADGTTMTISKLFKVGLVAAGVAGVARSIPIVKRTLESCVNEPVQSTGEWAQVFADRITADQLKAGIVEAEDEHCTHGIIIIAIGGSMWEVTTGLALPVTTGYHAIGSGAQIALGVMWAATKHDRYDSLLSPSVEAVDAAIAHMADIRGPILTVTT